MHFAHMCSNFQNRTLYFGPQKLIDRLHDTFKTPIKKLGFQFRKQLVKGDQVWRIWGKGEELQSRNQLQQPSLEMCELVHCRAGSENLESVCPPFTRDFFTKTSQFVVRYVYGTTLLKIVNHDYPLTNQKD
jgi:hypothetical protein